MPHKSGRTTYRSTKAHPKPKPVPLPKIKKIVDYASPKDWAAAAVKEKMGTLLPAKAAEKLAGIKATRARNDAARAAKAKKIARPRKK